MPTSSGSTGSTDAAQSAPQTDAQKAQSTTDGTSAPTEPKGQALAEALAREGVVVPPTATADEKREALVEAGYDENVEASRKQKATDDEARAENPEVAVIREANENFGGESFSYGV